MWKNLRNSENYGCIGEIELLIGERNENFAKDLVSEIMSAQSKNKKVEYLSEKIIIYSYQYEVSENQDLLIFEMVNRRSKNEEREHYYIANRNLHPSYLLNLINKGEMK